MHSYSSGSELRRARRGIGRRLGHRTPDVRGENGSRLRLVPAGDDNADRLWFYNILTNLLHFSLT